jgi:hypothetical protein
MYVNIVDIIYRPGFFLNNVSATGSVSILRLWKKGGGGPTLVGPLGKASRFLWTITLFSLSHCASFRFTDFTWHCGQLLVKLLVALQKPDNYMYHLV